MKMRKAVTSRVAVATLGGILLAGVAGAAFADEEQQTDDVDVNVVIEELTGPGTLAMTVADDATTLAEVDSDDPTERKFTGTLPSVTVSDTRTSIPEGAAWAVLGQASAFVSTDGGGQPDISAGYLGWVPRVVDPGETYEVLAGDTVDTVLDDGPNNVGLEGVAGPELLAMTLNGSGSAQAVSDSWAADADLFLKVPVDTAPGAYTSVLTLSLFE
ncbi:hypothetical protein [Microbacterium helvum]|nr:hypothetical protein [Microbacterium helvum]